MQAFSEALGGDDPTSGDLFSKRLTGPVRGQVVSKGEQKRMTQVLHKREAARIQIQVRPRPSCVTWTKILGDSVLGSVKRA